jgi:hypothetical protein
MPIVDRNLWYFFFTEFFFNLERKKDTTGKNTVITKTVFLTTRVDDLGTTSVGSYIKSLELRTKGSQKRSSFSIHNFDEIFQCEDRFMNGPRLLLDARTSCIPD